MHINYFDSLNWETMLNKNKGEVVSVKDYHNILCPDFPEFINHFTTLPILHRLAGIGLLCGTDWTPLYKNSFFYSRLDHSIGVALIIWNFTHDKAQTISGLLHDISTPVFSHVSDFRKGDALTQQSTEQQNELMIRNDAQLLKTLNNEKIDIESITDYHKYPIADNEIPQLSADRLEYMFPSGMILNGCWNLDEIRMLYNDIQVLINENDIQELGFKTVEKALVYCQKFCLVSHILQLNENKLALELLGKVMNSAEKIGFLTENDFMTLSEKKIIEKLSNVKDSETHKLFHTFRTMTKVIHTNKPVDNCFCVNTKVKLRYIDPLVKQNSNAKQNLQGVRLSTISKEAASIIQDFITWNDTEFGCVKYIN